MVMDTLNGLILNLSELQEITKMRTSTGWVGKGTGHQATKLHRDQQKLNKKAGAGVHLT